MNFRFARAQLFTRFSMEVKIVRREWIRKREKRLGELKHYSFQLGGLGGWVGSQPDNRVEKIHLLTLNHFEKDTTSRSLIYFLHSKESLIKQKKKIGNKIEKKKINFFFNFFSNFFFNFFFSFFFSISQHSICILIFVGLNDCIRCHLLLKHQNR